MGTETDRKRKWGGDVQAVRGDATVEAMPRCADICRTGRHMQDGQTGRHEQNSKMGVLWPQVGSQVCECHGQESPGKE